MIIQNKQDMKSEIMKFIEDNSQRIEVDLEREVMSTDWKDHQLTEKEVEQDGECLMFTYSVCAVFKYYGTIKDLLDIEVTIHSSEYWINGDVKRDLSEQEESLLKTKIYE